LSIGFLILLWIGCTIFLGPIIGMLGLNRSHREEAEVTHEQWQLRIHHLLGYVGLLGGTLGILYLVQRLDADSGALAIMLFTGGFVVLMISLALLSRLFATMSGKNGYYLALSAIFAVSALTYRADRKAEAAREADVAAKIAEIAALDRKAMREWIEDLHAAGAHGAPGDIPPMLEVQDSGDGVQVKNVSSDAVCLRISRHVADGDGSVDNRFRCSLLSRNRDGDCTVLGAGNSDWFELPQSPHRDTCIGQPLSFKIGAREGGPAGADVVWWSDPEIALLKKEIAAPRSQYGASGRFTLEETLAGYRALLRQGDRAGRWRAHIEAAERVESTDPDPPELEPGTSAGSATGVGAARKRVFDLVRFREGLEADQRNLPDYLKVSSDWKDEVVLANTANSAKRVQLLRQGRDAQGGTFFCAMHGSDSSLRGTLIARSASASFHLPAESTCPPNKRLPLHAEVRDESDSVIFMSGDLLDLRIAQAKEELAVLERAAD
jgi:hypothetical protein